MNTDFNDYGTGIGPQAGPQTILLAAADIEEVFFGGALGAGKTAGLCLDFERHHQQNGKITGMALRMSVPELDDMIAKFKDLLEPFSWEFLEGRKVFKHPDGSVLRMRHCEDERDVRKYWGFEYQWLGVDELGDMPDKTCKAIQKLRAARLRSSTGAKIRFVATGNPCGPGHTYCKTRYIDPAPAFTPFRDPESGHSMIFIPGHMRDNILMTQNDPNYKNRCKSMGPRWYVEALIEGDWQKSPEGGLFHREWMNNRFHLHSPPKFIYTANSWDTAFQKTKDSARSALTTWGLTETGFYLLYGFAAQLEFPELEKKAEDIWNANHASNNWIENRASGQSLIQTLKRNKIMPFKAIDVDQDKLRRAFAVTSYFESGRVFLPYDAPWLDEYIEEMCSFPAPTAFADYVDSTSQAITELVKVEKRMKRFMSNVVNLRSPIFER